MIISSADKKDVEVTFCDAGYAPGSKPENIQNKSAVWFKGDEWYRSKHESAIVTAYHIRYTKFAELHSISDRKSLPEGTTK